MLRRWQKSLQHEGLPTEDVKTAISMQNDKTKFEVERDLTQCNYLTMIGQEKEWPLLTYTTYLAPSIRARLGPNAKVDPNTIEYKNRVRLMKARQKGIKKIMSIHKMKDYRNETYHLAVNIFDRYLFLKGSKFDEKYITLLAVTVILMAAKIEQPISPSM
jgi:hypothetical protein